MLHFRTGISNSRRKYTKLTHTLQNTCVTPLNAEITLNHKVTPGCTNLRPIETIAIRTSEQTTHTQELRIKIANRRHEAPLLDCLERRDS